MYWCSKKPEPVKFEHSFARIVFEFSNRTLRDDSGKTDISDIFTGKHPRIFLRFSPWKFFQ